jgi:HKD family nuclease
MQIVTNQGVTRHGSVVRDLIAKTTKLWIFAAYVGSRGIEGIESAVSAACDRGVEIEAYCGLSQCVSHPDALWRLMKMCNRTKKANGRQTAKLYLCGSCDPNSQVFHPKLYCFFSPAGLTILIGSANLTAGGMANNFEVSALQTFSSNSETAAELRAFRKAVLEISDEADELKLSLYKRRYDIYHRERDRADKQAKKEIVQIRELKSKEIKMYLDRYHKVGKDADFQKRKARYRQARKLLDDLADAPQLGKAKFLRVYSELVGGGGSPQLWSSSGVVRHKGEVAMHHRRVADLVRDIRAISAKSPEQVFRIGSQAIKRIPGFGPNLLTETMHTFGTDRFPVLNKRPLEILEEFGYEHFPGANTFTPEDYARFTSIVASFKKQCGLESMAEADAFLSYVYGEEKKERGQGRLARRQI